MFGHFYWKQNKILMKTIIFCSAFRCLLQSHALYWTQKCILSCSWVGQATCVYIIPKCNFTPTIRLSLIWPLVQTQARLQSGQLTPVSAAVVCYGKQQKSVCVWQRETESLYVTYMSVTLHFQPYWIYRGIVLLQRAADLTSDRA